MLLVYYSSSSEYTHRFVGKLHHPARRIPLLTKQETLRIDEPFVLVTPTYGAGPNRGAVPKQVVKFLNQEENRRHLIGVIGAGNTNFGQEYCRAARKIAAKCNVPLMYRVELLGTPEDVEAVNLGLDKLCASSLKTAM
ncbi:MAG: class Ib ribonucleoside-diphosphate reductase assembly flavoprotein NrdI [Brevibacterium sp.]|uniref:class Ib ribonucleoside-diphosphate reductase assembly flavoprotein NrdI n=1 Tax=unclassified Brevibacterium TaxID=2614124 RepID=UPI001E5D8FE8|nr:MULTISPECIES: class Ib ribonucleoside-diphosphate reductase assembly flavoprotein NrdI [unclassified Brevibacterium]MCD1285714.1 class Ib ribonucleoside-diphosphate reductase assembly flavoprotein NrdI [Brevibacterium sp. CCUG 69071]MDK8434774.1 class Ib ribonucleoside-diphosphate reductase assembly flavoprotein NrdI [Brevibacterium sp. H-BE7]